MKNTPAKGKDKAPIIAFDQDAMRKELSEIVRKVTEEALNGLLDAEADRLCRAKKYERNGARISTRAGHYERDFLTASGNIRLKMPKLRSIPFETAIIERYRRRESSVEEAMIQMYLAGVSVRRMEDITEALWGSRLSSGTISQINQKIYDEIEAWRNRRLNKKYQYVYVDGIWLKRSWGGAVESVSVLVAIGVNHEGYREIIGAAEGSKEDAESWRQFLRYLKERGLDEIVLVISDKSLGLIEALGEYYPEAHWQRCVFHFYRNVLNAVPSGKREQIGRMLKAIHAQEDKQAARKKAEEVKANLRKMKLEKAATTLERGCDETLSYYDYPPSHWRSIRTNNPLERLNREIRRRTRVVGSFPDGHSALMLVCARLRYIAGQKWGTRPYMAMEEVGE